MDAIAEWTAAYQRVTDLLTAIEVAQAERTVPACPDWTVRQLLSHMIGLDADVLAGNEPDDHNPTWTQAQVEDRAGRSVPQLLEEWSTLAEPLQAWMADNTTRPLGDVIIHEQDLRGALAIAGGRDSEGFAALRDRMAGGFTDATKDLPPIALVGDGWSLGDADGAAVTVRAPDFDLARALMSRRSASQLRFWTEGDVEPYLPAFAALGSLPEHDIVE